MQREQGKADLLKHQFNEALTNFRQHKEMLKTFSDSKPSERMNEGSAIE